MIRSQLVPRAVGQTQDPLDPSAATLGPRPQRVPPSPTAGECPARFPTQWESRRQPRCLNRRSRRHRPHSAVSLRTTDIVEIAAAYLFTSAGITRSLTGTSAPRRRLYRLASPEWHRACAGWLGLGGPYRAVAASETNREQATARLRQLSLRPRNRKRRVAVSVGRRLGEATGRHRPVTATASG